MDTLGPGTLLAGRYRLESAMPTDLPGAQEWAARDHILDRPVRAVVLREGRVAQAQDAARRAALVADPRLLRVLDVGTHEGVAYVVTEPLPGRTLAELAASGLPADQARAVVGEAAVALEVARRRGVHHLALRPASVRVTEGGRVVVTGLAMDGELQAHGLGDARSTTRADTVGLVALLYLALTGRWPAAEGTPAARRAGGTPLAPRVDDAPVPPADLVEGVPNDLDTLCVVTMGPHDDGPHSPAELVRELEPWGTVDPDAFAAPAAAATTQSAARGGPTPVSAPAPVEAARAPEPAPAVTRQSVLGGQALGTVPPRPGAPPTALPPVIPPAVRRSDPRAPAAAAPAAARASTPVAAAPAAPASATIASPFGWEGRGARSAEATTRTPPTVATAPGPHRDEAHHAPFETIVDGAADVLVRKRFDPTPLVLLLVALTVVVGVAWAWRALTAPTPPIGGLGDVVDETPAPTQTPAGESPPAEEPAPVAPVIASAQMIDPPPEGDDNEHPEAVPLAIDGDPATFWYSRTYESPTYGMKAGIGYAVTLAQPATVSTVTLVVNGSGGTVEVRATDPATPTEGEVLVTGSLAPQTVLTLPTPVETQSIVLWFPELPQAPDGGNRVELAEITVS